ncbi:MAG: hypothetical protein H5T45_01515 [Thermoplasmatales archaeon]|nr:hypothetical protein [Thermoplasmatales archaeon]
MNNINENIKLKGQFNIKHIRDGKVIDERTYDNIIVNGGKAAVAGLILNDVTGIDKFDYIAIGTGTTEENATQTALVNEVMRTNATGSRVTTTVTDDTAQLVATFNFSSSYAITEAGVFNASSNGIMLCRKVFSAINVGNGDALQITYKIVVS